MSGSRYRLIDTARSELMIVTYPMANVQVGETVYLPGGKAVQVLDVYDDEHGQEGGVRATLVVDA